MFSTEKVLFSAFICLCAAAAGFVIGWCMSRHINKKEKR